MSKTESLPLQADIVTQWADDYDKLWENAGKCFPRRDLRERARSHVRGLLGNVKRKNGWQLAEYLGDASPASVQHLLDRAVWDAGQLRDEVRRYASQHLLAPGEAPIFVVDETGFEKKGDHSAGVQRQYSGTAGRVANCQIGVFLAFVGSRGRALIDRELYLPKGWCDDPIRREAAKIPEDVKFATKPKLAQQMLARALDAGLKPSWTLGDSVYGSDSKFRRFLEEREQPFVLAVTAQQRLWVGFRQKRVDAIAKDIPAEHWTRLSVGDGQKGPRQSDWAGHSFGLPTKGGLRRWVLFRRNVENPADMAYFLCLAPPEATVRDLAMAEGGRWSVECCFEAAKQETGLDEYEVRSWHGWYRHATLSMLALAFLAAIRSKMGEASPVKKTTHRWFR